MNAFHAARFIFIFVCFCALQVQPAESDNAVDPYADLVPQQLLALLHTPGVRGCRDPTPPRWNESVPVNTPELKKLRSEIDESKLAMIGVSGDTEKNSPAQVHQRP